MPSKTPQRKRMNQTKQADALYSKLIREPGWCAAVGPKTTFPCSGTLQCAHIISRRYRAIRWSLTPPNAIPACGAHHVYYTHRPLEWEAFIRERYDGLWDELRDMALHDPPEKAVDALARLKELADD